MLLLGPFVRRSSQLIPQEMTDRDVCDGRGDIDPRLQKLLGGAWQNKADDEIGKEIRKAFSPSYSLVTTISSPPLKSDSSPFLADGDYRRKEERMPETAAAEGADCKEDGFCPHTHPQKS